MRYLILIFLLVGCADNAPGYEGGECTACYEITNYQGYPEIVCYSQDNGICL